MLRLLVGARMLSLRAVAAAIGVTSIGYRLTHIVVENGLINARIVRLQAPVSGDIKALYARLGSLVKTGQVLARMFPKMGARTTELLGSNGNVLQSLTFVATGVNDQEIIEQAIADLGSRGGTVLLRVRVTVGLASPAR